jgi:hydrogenase nickel incorporation protein HypA/HybF
VTDFNTVHELSIAVRVVETLTEDLADEPGEVKSVRLRVGARSGVVPDALRFAWDVACHNTRLDGSSLEIDEVAARIWCDVCGREHAMPDAFSICCPICSEPASKVVAGRELEILSVEMAENEQAEAH